MQCLGPLGHRDIGKRQGKDPGEAVQKAVDLGIFTWAQICTGPAAETATCKTKLK